MDKKIPCDACGFYLDEVYMHKNENGKTYCTSCKLLINSNEDLDKIEPVSQEDLEKNLKTLLNTPPLKWKDLKVKLKKEREEKRKFREKKGSK